MDSLACAGEKLRNCKGRKLLPRMNADSCFQQNIHHGGTETRRTAEGVRSGCGSKTFSAFGRTARVVVVTLLMQARPRWCVRRVGIPSGRAEGQQGYAKSNSH